MLRSLCGQDDVMIAALCIWCVEACKFRENASYVFEVTRDTVLIGACALAPMWMLVYHISQHAQQREKRDDLCVKFVLHLKWVLDKQEKSDRKNESRLTFY